MKKILFLTTLIMITSGCSIVNKMAATTTAGLLSDGAKTFNKESDLDLAREGLPGNLKMMEAMLEVIPNNEQLLFTLSQGYCSFAFSFLEDSEKTHEVDRAKALYLRGYAYGKRALPQDFQRALDDGNLELIEKKLASVSKSELPQLFWGAYCLGNWVNLNKDDVNGVAELTKVELMMRRASELDPNYFYGGPNLFYGVYYGSRPKMLGGNPKLAKEYFEKAIAVTNGKFLMGKLFAAQFAAIPLQDEKLFDEYLKAVIDSPDDIFPDERFANLVAKRRAKKLLAQKASFF